MNWCPRCEQGWVVRCRIRGTEDIIKICEECDTVWKDREPTNQPPFVILDEYVTRYGIKPLWSNLDRLEQGSTD